MNSMGYPTKAERLKKIALKKRVVFLEQVEKEHAAELAKKRREEVRLTNIFKHVIKPALLDYMTITSERYGEQIANWFISFKDSRTVRINVYSRHGKDSFGLVPGREIKLNGIKKDALPGLSRLCKEFVLGAFGTSFIKLYPLDFTIDPKEPEVFLKDEFFPIYQNISKPYTIQTTGKYQEEVSRNFAKQKRNSIIRFIEKAARIGAGCVNITYSIYGDSFKIAASHTIGEELEEIWEIYNDLLYYNADYPKLNMISNIMNYWKDWLKNNHGFKIIGELPINYYKDPRHTGFQIIIYDRGDFKL